MRLPCFFKSGNLEAAYVLAILESKTLHTYATLEFLVDTGATRTTISDKDAIRLAIDYQALQKLPEGMLGIGGTVDTYTLKDATLTFHKQDKKTHQETLECICILKHTPLSERILRIPSILGRDILNKHALIYDKRQEKAYITDEQTP
jgi:hypothetical protein